MSKISPLEFHFLKPASKISPPLDQNSNSALTQDPRRVTRAIMNIVKARILAGRAKTQTRRLFNLVLAQQVILGGSVEDHRCNI